MNKISIFNLRNAVIVLSLIALALSVTVAIVINKNKAIISKTACYHAHENGMPCFDHQLELDTNQFTWIQKIPDTIYHLPNGVELVSRYESEKIAEKLQPAIDNLASLVKERILEDPAGVWDVEFGEKFLLLNHRICKDDETFSTCDVNFLFLNDYNNPSFFKILDNHIDGLNDGMINDEEDQINGELFRRIAPEAKKAFNVVYYDEVMIWIAFLKNYPRETYPR